MDKQYAIIIPAQNEEAVIDSTIQQLKAHLPANCRIAVGLNNCTDGTRQICEKHGDVVIGETHESGYGWGCQIAVEAVDKVAEHQAYIFFAADGANNPRDIVKMIQIHEQNDQPFVMGLRKFQLTGWFSEFGRSLPNLVLGLGCSALGGQFFYDLGPLRLIDRKLFQRLKLTEMVWGWTIEAQIKAGLMSVPIYPIVADEYPRQAGEQKISGVSMIRSSQVGWAILKAAIRTRKQWLKNQSSHQTDSQALVA